MMTVERPLERFAESEGGAAPVTRHLAPLFHNVRRPLFATAESRSGNACNFPNRESALTLSLLNFPQFNHIRFSNTELPVGATNRNSGVRFSDVAGTCSSSRATPSRLPVTNHESRVTNHVSKGGTVNRPLTRVSHRKQQLDTDQGRNFPSHFKYPLLPSPRLRQRAMVSFP